MITVQENVASSSIRQSAQYVLFVEGSDQNSIDPIILSTLLEENIRVEPLGPSYHIKSVAEGLHKYHPEYYFLIDRDHYDDEYVKNCWDYFPDPHKPNLLIWRRREIENYFLIPEYISKSKYLSKTKEQLSDEIIKQCTERLYIDAANQVIISIREDLKKNWIEIFTDPNEFKNKEAAINKLIEVQAFDVYKKTVSNTFDSKEIKERFEKLLDEMTGGIEPLKYGCGKWIEMIRGKKIFPGIVQRCFSVKDAKGKRLTGKEQMNEVVKDLLKKPLKDQPDDFKDLHTIIYNKILKK